MTRKNLDLSSFASRLDDQTGRTYWRSLEELHEDPEFIAQFEKEFPREAAVMNSDGFHRRDFFRLMSASLAAAGLAACAPATNKIIPYVRQPEEIIPGKPLFYASAMTLGGVGTGVLVESHTGRPTKIEGNPRHPGSVGATDAFMQGAILGMYDPDRAETVRELGQIATWTNFIAALQPLLMRASTRRGEGFRLLTENIVSPTLGAQIKAFMTANPAAVWHQYEPVSRDNELEGARLALGTYANTIYNFDQADVVVALDSDFLSCGPGTLRYARDFASRRRVRRGKTTMNRYYAVYSTPTGSTSIADHRLPVKPSEIESYARAIAAAVGAPGGQPALVNTAFVAAAVKDLLAHRGRSIVIAGDAQPPQVHALAHAINSALGNSGRTVQYSDRVEAQPVNNMASIRQLAADMHAGRVETLVIIGANPVFTAPADLRFAEAMDRVRFRAQMSPYYDETSLRCHWHIPQTHFLEEWSDTRAFDGTASIVQPLIAPLYNGRSPHELLGLMTESAASPYDSVRAYWQANPPAGATDFELSWRDWLRNGVIPGTALPRRSMAAAGAIPPQDTRKSDAIEVIFRPDPTIYDGRFANNGWLQELPKPITKLTWDNAVYLSPATAARLNVSSEELVSIKSNGRTLKAPVWIVPGHADETATVFFGYGRKNVGKVAEGAGFDTYALRTAAAPYIAPAVIERTREKYRLASTQLHQRLDAKGLEERHIVREGSLADYVSNPQLFADPHTEMKGPTLYPEHKYEGYSWGMVIDTSVCTGCNGCVIACQSENNIPIVGKDQVLNGREMHWIRVDHYYKGDQANPEEFNAPVPCMHCENAPCEPVCPVEATSHSSEGLNDMTYNRCVGTRYCANNCPYKVRRFNFYEYSDYVTPSLKPMRNPDVTLRTRGVMEKCTFCVQRINSARIESEREGRSIRDGEITTACAAACPTQAIVFGNINDKNSEVAKLKAEPTNYGMLAELNTQPRTTYLATLRNPNAEIKPEKADGVEGPATH